jgi:hypothetical protein
MNINQKTYELINSYLSGELQGGKLDAFKAELKTNKDLREKLKLQEAIIAGIQEVRLNELKNYIKNNASREKNKQRPIIRISLTIAASVGLILVVFFSIRSLINSDTGSSYSSNYKDSLKSIEKIKAIEDQEINQVTTTSTPTYPKNSRDTQLLAIAPIPELEITDEELTELNIELTEDEVIDIEDNEIIEELEDFDSESIDAIQDTIDYSLADTKSTNDDSNSMIRTDQLIATSYKSVRSFSNIEITDSASSASENIGQKATSIQIAQSRTKTTQKTIDKNSTIQIEYWNSVVGFYGYKYDGNILQLFGITQNDIIYLLSLDDRLYLKKGNQIYGIEKSSSTKRFSAVTNPILLRILHE